MLKHSLREMYKCRMIVWLVLLTQLKATRHLEPLLGLSVMDINRREPLKNSSVISAERKMKLN
jgi:hypothetical protein